jgi:hypothetical protein
MKNNYPRGKLNASDEGALAIAVYEKDKTVVIDFGKDIKWIGMDKDTALNLAQTIIDKANKI